MHALALALKMKGALPALKRLDWLIKYDDSLELARALSTGTVLLLRQLNLLSFPVTEEGLNSLSDMLDARARILGCQRLNLIHPANHKWLDYGSLATRIRLWSAVLPATEQLPLFTWNTQFEPCFRDLRPSFTSLHLRIPNDGTFPSSNVLETMPALKTFGIVSANFNQIYRAETFRPIIQTLYRKIALQNLEKVLFKCRMSDEVLSDLLAAVDSCDSAKRLTYLVLSCDMGVEGARSLADTIGRDIFPALDVLILHDNPRVSDEGVIALTEALRSASQTFLRGLALANVGMCDRGMVALASVVRHGRLKRLEELDLSHNIGVTDDGIIALAREIDARGLPKLRLIQMLKLDKMKVTTSGFGAIAYAAIKGSPQLKSILMECNEQEATSLKKTI